VECEQPPEKPRGGSVIWNGEVTFESQVIYTCGQYAKFQTFEGEEELLYDFLPISCQWNKTWTTVEMDKCLCVF
jgi:hypothetical protein